MIEPRYGSYNATGERYPSKQSNKVSNAAGVGSLAAAGGTGYAASNIGSTQKKVASTAADYAGAKAAVGREQLASTKSARFVPVGGVNSTNKDGSVKKVRAKASVVGEYHGRMDAQNKAAAAGVKSLKALKRFRMGALLGGAGTVGLGVTAANTRAGDKTGA